MRKNSPTNCSAAVGMGNAGEWHRAISSFMFFVLKKAIKAW